MEYARLVVFFVGVVLLTLGYLVLAVLHGYDAFVVFQELLARRFT